MVYEPDYGDFDDSDYEDEEMEPDDCPFGNFGHPQLGCEECEFGCPFSETCQDIFYTRKDCVNPLQRDDEGYRSIEVDCVFFHMGNCYIDFSNYSPSKLRAFLWRLKCRLGIIPPIKRRIAAHYD